MSSVYIPALIECRPGRPGRGGRASLPRGLGLVLSCLLTLYTAVGGASPTGWPLHRMTLQPWRIYDPSFRYRHSVYEGLNAHVLARDDGRDQPPGGLPPGPQAALPLIMHEMAHLRFHDALSLFIPLLSRSGRLMDSQAASVRTLITPPSSLSPRR